MATLADLLRTGYVPPKESALADPIKEHFRSLPQKFEENQRAQMDLLARAYPGNTYKSMMLEGDPAAMSELAMQAPIGGMMAYHGTPHKILGKFDISKVGTGEGNQSYGHGMYFAENPNVAKGYQETLGQKKDIAVFKGNDGFYVKKGLGSEGQNIAGPFASGAEAEKIRKLLPENQGNLYKVDIPDEFIPNMLDWDKPFKNQSPSVQAAIKQLEPKIKQINPNLNVENLDGKGIYQAYQQYRGNQPDFASEGMNELGIKGIRYLDQGSRNPGFSSLTPTQLQSRIESLQTDIKSGGGNQAKMKDQLKALQNEMESYKNMTSNFVVFEPSTVKILEENSKPLSRKEVIKQELKKRVK
jgi:hypothetical protein